MTQSAHIGQLGITAGPREIKDGSQYNKYFPNVTEKQKVVKPDGDVDNVVEEMIKIVSKYSHQTAKIAKKLKAHRLIDTFRNIFNFAYFHLQYERDQAGIEELRTPARAWHDGQVRFKQQGDKEAGIDCDDYAMFCGSILHELGIPFKFRITKYYGRSYFQHVYVAVPYKGSEVIIDPVLDKFNYEKPYTEEKSDFDMGILGRTLSGIGVASEDQAELISIANGSDFDTLDGLGATDDAGEVFEKAVFRQLVKTRNQIEKSPQLFANIQDPGQMKEMFDQAIKHFYSPKRNDVLNKLAEIESRLEAQGLIHGLDGLSGGFFKKLKNGLKNFANKTKKALKKVGRGLVRFNPVTASLRGAVLAGIRMNMLKVANKLAFGYLSLEEAQALGYNQNQWKKLVKARKKAENVFFKMGGVKSKFRKAVKKGNRKNNKYPNPVRPQSLNGFSDLGAAVIDDAALMISGGGAVVAALASIMTKAMDVKKEKAIAKMRIDAGVDKPEGVTIKPKNVENQVDTPAPTLSKQKKESRLTSWIKEHKTASIGIGVGLAALTLVAIPTTRKKIFG